MTSETNDPKGTEANTNNKKAAPVTETAAKSQSKPKTVAAIMPEETTTDESIQQPVAFLNNKAWLVLLPLSLIATITGTALVFTSSNSSQDHQRLEQMQLKFDSYKDGVRDVR